MGWGNKGSALSLSISGVLGFWFYFGLGLGSFGLFASLCFKTPDSFSGTGLLEEIDSWDVGNFCIWRDITELIFESLLGEIFKLY